MATTAKRDASTIFQLKVELLDTVPPVWRRVLVPADLTLARLNSVIQVSMGWDGSHLHHFRAGKQIYGEPSLDEDFFVGPKTIDERKVRIDQVLARAGSRLLYTYDFGDSWEHSVVLEKRLPADPKMVYPQCIAGERACPPEDCGGIPGYYDLLDAIQDPKHEQHEELLEWVGEEWDPDQFSIDRVNRVFASMKRRRRE